MDKVGSYKGLTDSYMMMEDFIELMDQYRQSELSFEQRLNLLKITNVQNLSRLKKEEEARLLQVTMDNAKAILEQEREAAKERIQATIEAKRVNGDLTKEQAEEERKYRLGLIDEEFDYKLELKEKELKEDLKNIKKRKKEEEKQKAKEKREGAKNAYKEFKETGTWAEKKQAIADYAEDRGISKKTAAAEIAMNALADGLSDMLKKLDNTIDKIGEKKGLIDTRLQGTSTD